MVETAHVQGNKRADGRFRWLTAIDVGNGARTSVFPFLGLGMLFAIMWCLFYTPAVIPASVSAGTVLPLVRLTFLSAHALSLALAILLARWISAALFDRRALVTVGVVFAVGASVTRFWHLTPEFPVATCCGMALLGIAFTWITLMWGSLFRFLKPMQAVVVVPASMLLGILVYTLVCSLVSAAAFAAFLMLPAFGIVLARHCARTLPATPQPRTVRQGARISRGLVLYMSLLAFACGYFAVRKLWMNADEFGLTLLFAVAAFSITLFLVSAGRGSFESDFQRRLSTTSLIAVAGLLLSTFIPGEYFLVSFTLVTLATLSVDIMFWSLLATAPEGTHVEAFAFFCKNLLFIQLGKLSGTVLGYAVVQTGTAGGFLVTALPLVIVYAIIACIVLSLWPATKRDEEREREQEAHAATRQMIVDALNAQPVPAANREEPGEMKEPTPGDDAIARACGRVSREFKLTPRETEVLGLLARGRNAAFVQKELVLSQSTAKTHIKHIYQKLGVHSSQELLDVVDGRREA